MISTLLCAYLGITVVSALGHFGGHPNHLAGGRNRFSGFKGQFPYQGSYNGKCDRDGIFYNSANSLVFCSNGAATVQYCAPGTRNSDHSHYKTGVAYGYNSFCDVNLNDYGFSARHRGYGNRGGYGGGFGAGFGRGGFGPHGNGYGAGFNNHGYRGGSFANDGYGSHGNHHRGFAHGGFPHGGGYGHAGGYGNAIHGHANRGYGGVRGHNAHY